MSFSTPTTTQPTSIELSPELIERTCDATTDEPVIRIRPFPETDGIEAGPRFLRGLHRAPAGTLRRGAAPVYAAEIWFLDGKIQFSLRAPDRQDATALVDAHYPNSETEAEPEPGFAAVSSGEYVAGCHLELQHDAALPLKHLDSTTALEHDPYRTVLSRLIGTDEETNLLQIVFMPVSGSWTRRGLLGRLAGGSVGSVARARREGQVTGYLDPQIVQSKQDTRAADDIGAQVGRPAFTTTIRALAIAPDASTAEHRLTGIADAVTEFDHVTTDQRLAPTYTGTSQLPAVVEAAGMRALTPDSRIRRALWGRADVLTVSELAGLVHLPNEEVENAAVDWSRTAAGTGVPADTPTFSETVSESEAPAGVTPRRSHSGLSDAPEGSDQRGRRSRSEAERRGTEQEGADGL